MEMNLLTLRQILQVLRLAWVESNIASMVDKGISGVLSIGLLTRPFG
jgi:hypothetical protein